MELSNTEFPDALLLKSFELLLDESKVGFSAGDSWIDVHELLRFGKLPAHELSDFLELGPAEFWRKRRRDASKAVMPLPWLRRIDEPKGEEVKPVPRGMTVAKLRKLHARINAVAALMTESRGRARLFSMPSEHTDGERRGVCADLKVPKDAPRRDLSDATLGYLS